MTAIRMAALAIEAKASQRMDLMRKNLALASLTGQYPRLQALAERAAQCVSLSAKTFQGVK